MVNELKQKILILYTDSNSNFFILNKQLFDVKQNETLKTYFKDKYVNFVNFSSDETLYVPGNCDNLTTGLYITVNSKLIFLQLSHPIAPLCIPSM